jgi:hypothetical protein
MQYNMIKKIIYSGLFLVCLTACIEPFELDFVGNSSVLIVDNPIISTTKKKQLIRLLKTLPSKTSSINLPLSNATVSVLVNGTQRIRFLELENLSPGSYESELEFAAAQNTTYQLEIVLSDGAKYRSTEETLVDVTPINRAYQLFDETRRGMHKIYIDTQDPANQSNFYLWNWILYEKQPICVSCNARTRYEAFKVDEIGKCEQDVSEFVSDSGFDYYCTGNCWEILYSSSIKIFSDELSNGKELKGVEVAQIPYYSTSNSLLVISQQSISKKAYNYFKVFNDQNFKSGGLTDTPPATLISNVTQDSGPILPVTGYFMVSSQKEFRYVITKNDVPNNGQYFPLGLLPNGRFPNPEPLGIITKRPPTAACVNSFTRTNIGPVELIN